MKILRTTFFLFLLSAFCTPAFAALDGWTYRVPVQVSNFGNGIELTNHQVLVTVNTAEHIQRGEMNADGSDIRFFDSDDQTMLDYWIEDGTMNRSDTRIWVKIPLLPDKTKKIIYFYYGNPSAETPVSNMKNTMVSGEVGQAAVSSSYTTVNLSGKYTSPIVAASHVEGSDNQEVSVRIKDVSSTSFQIKLDHPSGSSFNANTAYYVVVEEGQLETLNGVLIEAHRDVDEKNVLYKGGPQNAVTTLTFSHNYQGPPVVFSQVMTANDTRWVTEALRRTPAPKTIEAALELAETGTSHNPETIGWIAMQSSKTGLAINNIFFETATAGNVQGHDDNNGQFETKFKGSFRSAPLVITDMSSRQETDGGWTAIESVSTTSLIQHIEEDRVTDAERNHAKENTSILAFERAGDLIFRKFARSQPAAEILYPITQIVFLTPLQSLFVNQVSQVMAIQSQDQFGTPRGSAQDITISLSSTSSGGQFSLSRTPFIPVTETKIPAGTPVGFFYYRDTIVGNPIITATAPSQNWTPATQQVAVGDVIFRGGYRVPITIDNSGCGSKLTNHQVLVTVDTPTLIAQGKMKEDGADIRFLDENKSTPLNYWMASQTKDIKTTPAKVWVKVPEIPASSSKTIYLYYGNPEAVSSSNMFTTMVMGEISSVIPARAGFKTVGFIASYTSPIVMASHEEREGVKESSARIKNVSSTSFEIGLETPGGGPSDSQGLYYFALEEGRHSTLDGILVEAGKYNAANVMGVRSKDNTWGNITFSHNEFSAPPVLFSQVMTANDSTWVTEALNTITTAGAQSAMELAETRGNSQNDHGDETIGWVAFENNKKGSINGNLFETKIVSGIRGHDDTEVEKQFSQSFKDPPLIITDLRTRTADLVDWPDGGWTAMKRKTNTSFFLHVEEDNVFDPERFHPAEEASVIAFEKHSALPFRAYVCQDQPDTTNGSEETVVFKLVFTTSEQILDQHEVSSVMTVQTQSIQGNAQNVEEDTIVTLSSSSLSGEFSDSSSFFTTITQMTIPKGKNTIEFYYRDSEIGTPTITVSESPSQEWTDAQQDVVVIDPVTQFLVETSSPQIAGQEFKLKVTALDENRNTALFFQGAVNLTVNYLTPSTGTKGLLTTTLTNFVNGTAEISNEIYPDCGTISITATRADDATKTGTSNPIYFAPKDFILAFDQVNSENPLEHTVSQPFGLDITARNIQAETCLNYVGPASLEIGEVNPLGEQGGTISPSQLSFSDFKGGQAVLTNTTYNKWGEVRISCFDNTVPAQTGVSENIVFLPKDFLLVNSEPKPLRTFFYLNEPFKLTVTARDFVNGVVSNYFGTIQLTGTGFHLPGEYTFTEQDNGLHTFEDISGTLEMEKGIITARDKNYPKVFGLSSPLDIKEASIQAFSNQGPVGNLAINVAVIDKEGNVITEDNSTLVTVEFDEFIEDGSVTSVSGPVSVKEGRATIIIHDSQAEEVIVIPQSDPVLKSISGLATFGTAAKTGVGIQMYRELKDE